MKVTYTGPFDEIEINATGQLVKHNATIDVEDALGELLCEQVDNWKPAKSKSED